MLHRRHRVAAGVPRLMGGLMTDELLAGDRMLAVGYPFEMFFADFAGESPAVRQLAIPAAANHLAPGVVVLARVLEFFLVVSARLARAQRLRDSEHERALLEERLLSYRRGRPFVGNQRLRRGRLND